jgi:hypothetical protein
LKMFFSVVGAYAPMFQVEFPLSLTLLNMGHNRKTL